MLEVVSQIIIYLILATLIGIIIGYFLGKNECPREREPQIIIKEKPSIQPQEPEEKIETEIGKAPTLLNQAREGKKDNLQLIKGLGPVLEKVLNETGIYHFDQIANLTKEEIHWLDSSIAFPGRIEREDWIAQAKSLNQGIATEYSKRVKSGEVTIKKS